MEEGEEYSFSFNIKTLTEYLQVLKAFTKWNSVVEL